MSSSRSCLFGGHVNDSLIENSFVLRLKLRLIGLWSYGFRSVVLAADQEIIDQGRPDGDSGKDANNLPNLIFPVHLNLNINLSRYSIYIITKTTY